MLRNNEEKHSNPSLSTSLSFQERLKIVESKLGIQIKVPENLCDPISGKIMNCPVKISNGVNFDNDELVKFVQEERRVDGLSCFVSYNKSSLRRDLTTNCHTNVTIYNLINEFVEAQEKFAEEKPIKVSNANVIDASLSNSNTSPALAINDVPPPAYSYVDDPNKIKTTLDKKDIEQLNETKKLADEFITSYAKLTKLLPTVNGLLATSTVNEEKKLSPNVIANIKEGIKEIVKTVVNHKLENLKNNNTNNNSIDLDYDEVRMRTRLG